MHGSQVLGDKVQLPRGEQPRSIDKVPKFELSIRK